MHSFAISILLGAVVSLAAVVAPPGVSRCGTIVSAADKAANERMLALAANRTMTLPQNKVTLEVYFHIVSDTNGDGKLSDSHVKAQVITMNAVYAKAGISWVLAGIKHYTDSTRFKDGATIFNVDFVRKTRIGGASGRVLNLYTFGPNKASAQQGASAVPWASSYAADGAMIWYKTVPGGTTPRYSLGMAAVHTTGHWLGLYHPFEGGCSGDGDFVDDTPPQAKESYGCDTNLDSCKGDKYLDPVRNVMGFSDDSCMDGEFTPGQAERMHLTLQYFRV